MKAIKFLALGLIATMIVSCSSDEVALTNKEVTATLTGNIGSSLKTRAHDNVWEADDEIGVFIYEITPAAEEGAQPTQTLFEGNFNTKFVTKENGNTKVFKEATDKAILYPSNKHELSFHAYYPYTESVTEESPVFIPNWTDQTKSQNLDLLVSDTQTGDKDHQRVELTFNHKFARIILNIDANTTESQIQYSDLVNLKITAANMSADVEYDVINDKYSKKDVNTEDIVFNTNEDGRYSSAIICPGVNDGEETRVITFTLENGKQFVWNIDKKQMFEEGNSYSWNITLKGQGLVDAVLIGTIVNWGDGTIEGDTDFELEEEPEATPTEPGDSEITPTEPEDPEVTPTEPEDTTDETESNS